jgi:hypothetical protein
MSLKKSPPAMTRAGEWKQLPGTQADNAGHDVDAALKKTCQFELQWAGFTRSYGKLPAPMTHQRERLVSLLNAERPGRKCDQAVKAMPKRYAIRRGSNRPDLA